LIAGWANLAYNSPMEIEFDAAKDAINQAKHKLSLADGGRVFEDDNHIIFPTIREEDGERRYKAVGMLDKKLHTVVFVWRGKKVRCISVRRSNDGEKRRYRTSG
jgi:uncharacterized DUF497 family protein